MPDAPDRPVWSEMPIQCQPEAIPGRLIWQCDCTEDYPPEHYLEYQPTRVVASQAGRYREAEGVPFSRFGYRFPIEHIGKPHEAVIRFPDDKRRFMCVMDGTCYDLSTGVLTGGCQPLSGKMLELRQIFWPRWTDCSIILQSWGDGEPAAAASIEIYELDELTPLAMPDRQPAETRREIGIQYEDPCGTCASEGALTHEEWIERVIAYLRYTGQDSLTFPMAWYHGPIFPSAREPSSQFEWVTAPDRNCYSRWSSHPTDWHAHLLARLSAEGLQYRGALTLLRLGSLMEHMQTDEAAIHAGAETCNNVLWNGTVRAGTGDWTPMYEARFMSQLAAQLQHSPSFEPLNPGHPDYPPYLYGEHPNPNGPGPIFNPLHPTVQAAIIGFVREIAERYSAYPAFTGISFNYFAAGMLWFGSLRTGYDDFSIDLFQRETGIRVPGEPRRAARFQERYHFLTTRCRAAWIAWRCAKIHDLICRVRDVLIAARPDLTVTLTLWQETVIPALYGIHAGSQLSARPGAYEVYREGGVDWELYRHELGILLDLEMGNPRDRGGHGPAATAGARTPLDCDCMYRDHDFLDRSTLEALGRQDAPGVFIFNCWMESWGERHVWLPVEPSDPNLPLMAEMSGRPIEGIVRSHSEYPHDAFWWEPQMRITPPLPAGAHFLEPYAHAVAELDALRITRGGLFLDKTHSAELRQFARAYRALPREKFTTVGTSTDPVAARTLLHAGRRYLYLVNRDYYPVRVEVVFDHAPETITDLATGRDITAADHWQVELGPYELRAVTMPPASAVISFSATLPPEIEAQLRQDGARALQAIAATREEGRFVPGMDEMKTGILSALAGGRFAWLRRALSGYITRACLEAARATTVVS